MSHRARRVASALLMTSLLSAALAAPAGAVPQKTVTDATKDVKVWRKEGRLPARYRAATDITQVTYSRDADRFYVKFRLRDVQPNEPGLVQQVHVGAYMSYSKENGTYYDFWDMRGNTRGGTSSAGTRCRAGIPLLSFSSAEDWILISIPKRCIRGGKVIKRVHATVDVHRDKGDNHYYGQDFAPTTAFRIRD